MNVGIHNYTEHGGGGEMHIKAGREHLGLCRRLKPTAIVIIEKKYI